MSDDCVNKTESDIVRLDKGIPRDSLDPRKLSLEKLTIDKSWSDIIKLEKLTLDKSWSDIFKLGKLTLEKSWLRHY